MAQIAGSERVEECSSAVVMCAEFTGESTPEPSFGSRLRVLPKGRDGRAGSSATLSRELGGVSNRLLVERTTIECSA
jgi:hypothetical protein